MSKAMTTSEPKQLQLDLSIENFFSPDNLDDLTANVTGGFSVLSMRGGKWRVKVGGEETLVTDEDGDPRPSIPVVILKASPYISRNFYKGKYTEDSDAPPDCFSLNGEAPDPASPSPQAKKCSMCPQNEWGSKISEVSGKRVKACSSARRIIVVPATDKVPDPDTLRNEQYGGLMLYRVPTTAVQDLAAYARMIRKKLPTEGYNSIVTRLSFDPDVSYPKPSFKPLRKLSDEEKKVLVEEMVDEARMQDMLVQSSADLVSGVVEAEPEQTEEEEFFEVDIDSEAQAKAEPAKAEEAEDDEEEAKAKAIAEEELEKRRQAKKQREAEAAKAAETEKAAKAAEAKKAKAKAEKPKSKSDTIESSEELADMLDELQI